jgi:hypothetical protein
MTRPYVPSWVIYDTLSAEEQHALSALLDHIDWWEVRRVVGVQYGIARLARDGGPVLTTTAAKIRAALQKKEAP